MIKRLPEERAHGAGCDCLRCKGFAPGNAVAATHGAYVEPSRFDARVTDLADAYRPHLPVWCPADEPVLRMFCVTIVRVERASAALSALDERTDGTDLGGYLVPESEKLGRLRQDLRSWISLAARLADQLGMSPGSRARLAGDLAGAQRTLTLEALRGRYATSEAA